MTDGKPSYDFWLDWLRDGRAPGSPDAPTPAEVAEFLRIASRLPPDKLRRVLAAVRDALDAQARGGPG